MDFSVPMTPGVNGTIAVNVENSLFQPQMDILVCWSLINMLPLKRHSVLFRLSQRNSTVGRHTMYAVRYQRNQLLLSLKTNPKREKYSTKFGWGFPCTEVY